MPRTAVTAQASPSTGSGGAAATGLILTMAAGDVANGNKVVHTGKQMIVACNTNTTTDYHLTVSSVADSLARTGDITSFVITHNADISQAIAIFGPFPTLGWQQSDGNLYFSVDNAAVKLTVVTVP